MICKAQPGSKIESLKCRVKNIDRKHLKIDVAINSSASLFNIETRGRFYYRYNIYQRVGGELRINVCDWMAKRTTNVVLEWMLNSFLKHTNLNHTCPYNQFYFKVDNISIDEFAYPQIMPSGQYRTETIVQESADKILFNFSLYFSISDHRVEILTKVK